MSGPRPRSRRSCGRMSDEPKSNPPDSGTPAGATPPSEVLDLVAGDQKGPLVSAQVDVLADRWTRYGDLFAQAISTGRSEKDRTRFTIDVGEHLESELTEIWSDLQNLVTQAPEPDAQLLDAERRAEGLLQWVLDRLALARKPRNELSMVAARLVAEFTMIASARGHPNPLVVKKATACKLALLCAQNAGATMDELTPYGVQHATRPKSFYWKQATSRVEPLGSDDEQEAG